MKGSGVPARSVELLGSTPTACRNPSSEQDKLLDGQIVSVRILYPICAGYHSTHSFANVDEKISRTCIAAIKESFQNQ